MAALHYLRPTQKEAAATMPDRAAFYTANLKFRGDETEKRRPSRPGEP
jgi:hypothetical protein